jgi:fumarate reductase subunit C
LSIIFFLLASIHGPSKNFITPEPSDSPTQCEDLRPDVPWPSLAPRIVHACTAVLADHGASMVNVAVATAPKAMFIFLPVIAFFHMLLYWRPRHRYVEHLLFFLHLHAMVFSVAIVIVGLVSIGNTWKAWSGPLNFVINPLVWATAVYSVIAMRRVFGRTWIGTLFKAFVMMMVYFIVFGLAVAGVFLYAALQL